MHSRLKKIDELRLFFTQSNVDVICVSEAWFVNDQCDSSIVYEGFNVFHAGGVAIYVNVKLKCKVVLKQPSDSTIEYVLIEIPKKSHGRTLLGCIYRPNRTIEDGSLLNVVSDISLEYTDIIWAGDFNSILVSESHLVDNFKSLDLYSVNETIPKHYRYITL